VIFLLGRHDYSCPWPIAEAWMKKLSAPKKRIVWFENSAHLPMIEEPGRVDLSPDFEVDLELD
jgi:proline iminopeptidase